MLACQAATALKGWLAFRLLVWLGLGAEGIQNIITISPSSVMSLGGFFS